MNVNEILRLDDEYDKFPVNARDLWTALQSKHDFTGWINARIKKYGFVEGQDFSRKIIKISKGGRAFEYRLTLEMAREIIMAMRNDIGREVRKFFIRKEKELWETEGRLSNPEYPKKQFDRLLQSLHQDGHVAGDY